MADGNKPYRDDAREPESTHQGKDIAGAPSTFTDELSIRNRRTCDENHSLTVESNGDMTTCDIHTQRAHTSRNSFTFVSYTLLPPALGAAQGLVDSR